MAKQMKLFIYREYISPKSRQPGPGLLIKYSCFFLWSLFALSCWWILTTYTQSHDFLHHGIQRVKQTAFRKKLYMYTELTQYKSNIKSCGIFHNRLVRILILPMLLFHTSGHDSFTLWCCWGFYFRLIIFREIGHKLKFRAFLLNVWCLMNS